MGCSRQGCHVVLYLWCINDTLAAVLLSQEVQGLLKMKAWKRNCRVIIHGMRHLQEAEGNMNEQAKPQIKHSNEEPGPATPDEGARGVGGEPGRWVGCGCLNGKGHS